MPRISLIQLRKLFFIFVKSLKNTNQQQSTRPFRQPPCKQSRASLCSTSKQLTFQLPKPLFTNRTVPGTQFHSLPVQHSTAQHSGLPIGPVSFRNSTLVAGNVLVPSGDDDDEMGTGLIAGNKLERYTPIDTPLLCCNRPARSWNA